MKILELTRRAREAGLAIVLAGALSIGLTGCEDSGSDDPPDFGDNDPNTVVCIGDSITEGYGNAGYPPELAAISGKRTVNAGISGSLSSSGVSRTPSLLNQHNPAYLLILYGANDVIRGQEEDIVPNLRTMVQMAKAEKTVPVVGTLLPMTRTHEIWNGTVERVNPMIIQMADEENVKVADLNAAFGGNFDLLQDDGLHPTVEGNRVIAAEFNKRLD